MFNVLIQLKLDNTILMIWRQWCRDVASGIDRHPDRTQIDFRLEIQGNRKLIPCSRTFREVFSHPYISFFHLLVNVFFCYLYIKEYGSTLYVGLARAVSPTNTNFRLTFLLTRLQEALYEDLAV